MADALLTQVRGYYGMIPVAVPIAVLKSVTVDGQPWLGWVQRKIKKEKKMTKTKQLDEVRKTIRKWRKHAKANIKDCKKLFGDPMVPFWACRAETLLRCAEELEAMLDGRAEKRIDVPRDFTPK
mgnify:FL=1